MKELLNETYKNYKERLQNLQKQSQLFNDYETGYYNASVQYLEEFLWDLEDLMDTMNDR